MTSGRDAGELDGAYRTLLSAADLAAADEAERVDARPAAPYNLLITAAGC